jgi:membrane protein DedA with SNARE-associated domain
MESLVLKLTEFLAAHQALTPFVATALAAAETTAFLSVLIPSTALLMAVGAAASTGAFPFLPIWVGAAIGALIGSTFSWWLGRTFGDRILSFRLFREQAALIDRAREIFGRWGTAAVFAGHYIGPLRPVVFLFAGLSGMSFWRFQVWNVMGAVSWAYVIPKTGELGGDLVGWFWHFLGF